MGDAIECSRPVIWMEKLVWETLFGCLKSYSIAFDIVWREWNSHMFEDIARPLNQLKFLLICTLFEWSRPCGFTHCTSIFEFSNSIQIFFYFL